MKNMPTISAKPFSWLEKNFAECFRSFKKAAEMHKSYKDAGYGYISFASTHAPNHQL